MAFFGLFGFLSRASEIFGGRRRAGFARARRLEAMGSLEEATALYVELGENAEAARVLVLRAEAAVDLEKKRMLFAQAATFAQGEQARAVEVARARLTLELQKSGAHRPSRAELFDLAARLEKVGEASLAAEVYAEVGDREAEARMLVEAGAIDRLEQVLDSEQARERRERERTELGARVRDLLLSGSRRQAARLAAEAHDDPSLAELAREIEARRPRLPRVKLELEGERLELAFGSELTLGRAEATLILASPAVSRTHLVVRRGPEGPEVEDLGSRNGTLLAGARLDAPVRVGDGLSLALGGEVPLELAPWRGGVRLAFASELVHAPLGGLALDGWTLTASEDGWLELGAEQAVCLDGLSLFGTIELLRGDRLRRAPEGPVTLEVVE